MKRSILFIIMFFLAFPLAFAQQYGWKDISANMPESGGFNDVHFISQEGWITGGNDKIYYTPDGGATFSIQQLPTGSGITSSVYMKNTTDGYAVTYSGNMLRGVSNVWTTLHAPGGTLNSVHFPPSSSTGFTCGNNGKVWSFDNSSIFDISPVGVVSELQSIIFPVDTTEGKVCGESIIKRYLSSSSWNNLQFYDNNYFYNSIYFIGNSDGWAVGSEGTIIHTSDGASWTIQISNTAVNLNDVFFINSLEGWAVGYGVLLHTTDGGANWNEEASTLTSGKILRAIYFTTANDGFVVGNNVVLKYGEVSGIDENSHSFEFDLFPNPADESVGINCSEFKTEGGTIEILSAEGKTLQKQAVAKGNEVIKMDLKDLAAGMYMCRITIGNKTSTRKLIIE